MAGNVREWVWHNSGVFDPEGSTDPRGPEELPGFVQRILRGMSSVKPGKFSKNYKAPNVADIKKAGANAQPKKKLFGLF